MREVEVNGHRYRIEKLNAFGNEPAPSTPEVFSKRLADDIAT